MNDRVDGESAWSKLGSIDPTDLVSARLELHWAAQIPAAAGSTLLPLRADASHTSLLWFEALGALVTEKIDDGSSTKRVGLRLEDRAIVILDAESAVSAELSLAGKTLEDGLTWLASTLAKKVVRPKHELPEHAVGSGGPFSEASPRDAELALWFEAAHQAVRDAIRDKPSASVVRCWPHHFDIASLVKLDETRSIGLGLSPGDASYAEPYFYVTPWPYPPPDMTLPAVRGVRWHTQGWTGAVLVGSRVVVAEPRMRARTVADMLREGYEAAAGLITPPSVASVR